MDKVRVSPSRTYVVGILNINMDVVSFRQFVMPEQWRNDTHTASWFFLNRLDASAVLDCIFTHEEFDNVRGIPVDNNYLVQVPPSWAADPQHPNTLIRRFKHLLEKVEWLSDEVENRYCPHCNPDGIDMGDQMHHTQNCPYVELMHHAQQFLEKK